MVGAYLAVVLSFGFLCRIGLLVTRPFMGSRLASTVSQNKQFCMLLLSVSCNNVTSIVRVDCSILPTKRSKSCRPMPTSDDDQT